MRLCILAMFIIILTSCSETNHKNNHFWRTTAINDLTEIKKILQDNHPGAVDLLNSEFLNILENKYNEAISKTKQIVSQEGYRAILQFYTNSFKDGHLSIRFSDKLQNIRWPGFIIRYLNNKFIVSYASDMHNFKNLPNIGDELLQCDNKSPRQLMTAKVFPLRGIEELEASWYRQTPMLFIDQHNPWSRPVSQCEFKTQANQQKTLHLAWKTINVESIKNKLQMSSFGKKPNMQAREVMNRSIWISIPSFNLQQNGEEKVLRKIISSMDKYRNHKNIVFDVRGNSGGSSMWGEQLVESLYGKKYVEYYRAKTFSKYKTSVDWRASHGNKEFLETLLPVIEKKFDKKVGNIVRQIIKGMSDAIKDGNNYYREEDSTVYETDFKTNSANPVTANVFLLTDGRCGSACLDFADLLLSMPRVRHVGQSTYADSLYLEARSINLSSKHATLIFPTKVYRNRKRGHNTSYIPKYKWRGDISATVDLEKWLLL